VDQQLEPDLKTALACLLLLPEQMRTGRIAASIILSNSS
jgi:hypothetical protein